MSRRRAVNKRGHRRKGQGRESRLLLPRYSQRWSEFGAWFHVTSPEYVCHVVRNDENLWHNLAYLNSYIHDARVTPSQMRWQGRSLVLQIIRDRWELYRHLERLNAVASSLKIGPVLGLDWSFDHATLGRVLKNRDKRLWVLDVAVDEGATGLSGDVTRLKVRGPMRSWSLVIKVPAAHWRIDLRDVGRRRL